jgi:TonB-dependent starch-binding outer membrane protein SusC
MSVCETTRQHILNIQPKVMQIIVCRLVHLLFGNGNKGAKPKQCFSASDGATKTLHQAVRIMKLTAILLLGACLHIQAAGYGQKISLSEKDVPIEQIFKKIQKQTDYKFLYTSQLLEGAPKVSIAVRDADIGEVLNLVFKEQRLDYEINESTIIVKPRKVLSLTEMSQSIVGDPGEVRGVITDENGAPAQGVNVMVKGTSKGTTTNLRGEFVLRDIPENVVLLITSVGYDRQEILVKDKKFITTQLRVAVGSLDELQVIAYGNTSRRFNTGNISTVKASAIEKQPVQNPLLALQGRVPGVEIIQLSGLNGAGITVRIQGRNSIQSGLDPLIVIDGVPYPSQLYTSLLERIVQTGSPLNYVNPSDVESINVLKDADATAIYGSRAANGAILITTKKGKAGKARVSFNYQEGWGKVGHKIDMMSTQEYLLMRNEALRNDGLIANPSVDFDLTLWDSTRYSDWQKILIGGKARYTNIYTSISGGSSTMQYLLGGTYNRQTTVFPGEFDDKKGSIHFHLTASAFSQKLKVQFSGNYMHDQNYLPGVDLTQQALLLEPNAPALYNEDGTLNWGLTASGRSSWINPLSYIMSTEFNNTTKNLVGNLNVSYSILPGLEIQSSFGYSNIQTDLYLASRLEANAPEQRATQQRYTNNGTRNMNSLIIEPQVTYTQIVGKGKIEGVVGGSILQSSSKILTVGGQGYPSDLLMQTLKAAKTVLIDLSMSTKSKFNALFTRFSYIWDNKYIINLAARRDGSSKFGDANKLHNFGSAAVGWIFSEEKWSQKYLPFMSFGKLRFSYGTTGNDQIGDFGHLSLYGFYNGTILYQNGIGLLPENIPNPHLQWEETRKLQGGVDLGFLNDRIVLGTTYAHNRSSNQLIAYVIPSTTGFTSITENLPAVVRNTSFEFTFNSTNLKNKYFDWSTYINLTIPRNKLLSFSGIEKTAYASGNNGVIIGQPLGIIKAYSHAGVDPITGKYQILDKDGNPTINYGSAIQSNLISNFLNYYGGIENKVNYKKFQFIFLFQFVRQKGGKDLFYYNGNRAPGRYLSGYSNQPVNVLNRWQKTGDNSGISRYTTGSSIPVVPPFTDAWLTYDASYIRLKNVSLYWQLPSKWLRKAYFQNGQLYFTAQNLLTITKYTGLDPENKSITSLPPLRVLTIGAQIEL